MTSTGQIQDTQAILELYKLQNKLRNTLQKNAPAKTTPTGHIGHQDIFFNFGWVGQKK